MLSTKQITTSLKQITMPFSNMHLVPSMGNVYIIGYGAKQVTIYAQQVRALKLLSGNRPQAATAW